VKGSRSDLKSIIDSLSLLNNTEREEIMSALQKLKESDNQKKAKITGLAGLGKEIWQGVDVDKYVRNLRDEWDDRKVR
jgi:hypothetical protein